MRDTPPSASQPTTRGASAAGRWRLAVPLRESVGSTWASSWFSQVVGEGFAPGASGWFAATWRPAVVSGGSAFHHTTHLYAVHSGAPQRAGKDRWGKWSSAAHGRDRLRVAGRRRADRAGHRQRCPAAGRDADGGAG